MISLTVKVGQVVEVGDALAIKVVEKKGNRVGLVFATMLSPIRISPTGILPERYSCGIGGESQFVPEKIAVPAQ